MVIDGSGWTIPMIHHILRKLENFSKKNPHINMLNLARDPHFKAKNHNVTQGGSHTYG